MVREAQAPKGQICAKITRFQQLNPSSHVHGYSVPRAQLSFSDSDEVVVLVHLLKLSTLFVSMEGSREDISQLLSSLRKLDSEKVMERKVRTFVSDVIL